MSNEQQIEVYQYSLNIICINMKIKFPCKMHLENNNQVLTTEVGPSSPNKFIFNQEITLKQDNEKQHFQVVIHLTTDKGAKYVGGVIKLIHSELLKSEGQRLVIPLIKCLDNEAACQLRVDQVSTSRIIAKAKAKNKMLGSEYNHDLKSPVGKSQGFGNLGGQTKSQYQFPISKKSKNKDWDRKSRQMPQHTYIPRRKSPSKAFNANQNGQPSFQGGSNQLQVQVYKEGYQKLKEKYKKETEVAKNQLNKRIALENNENNFKLEIMRYKLKCDQQQKSIADKTNKIKQLQGQLVTLQKKQLDLNYLKEQAVNKDHTIRMLQDTVKSLSKDNNQLKLLNMGRFTSDQQKIKQLKQELYQLKLNKQSRQSELQRQVKNRQQLLSKKQQQIIAKNQIIQRERYTIEDMQKNAQLKIFENEKFLQNQRGLFNSKLNDEKQKNLQKQRQIQKFSESIKQLNKQLQKQKSSLTKIQYDKKILIQSAQTIKAQIQEFKTFKQKFIQLSREHKFLQDDKNHLQKQLQKTIQSKDINLGQITKQHQNQLQYYKKINKQLEEKNKFSVGKIIQLESSIQLLKNQLQKSKRLINTHQKDLSQTKTKEKQLRSTLKSKDQQILLLQNDMADSGQKTKASEQSLKFQVQKQKQENDRLKAQNQSSQMKITQLTQYNSGLNIQLNKLKMKLQFTQQKSSKQISNLMDKITNLQTIIKDNQNQIANLSQSLFSVKSSEKSLLQSIKNKELQKISQNQTYQKLKKQVKILNQRNNNTQNMLKAKTNEFGTLQQVKQSLNIKIQQKQSQITNLRTQNNKLLGNQNKNQKIIQMLQNDLSKAKQETSDKVKNISEKDKTQEILREQIKKNKEEYTKLDMKLNSIKKEYQKFKDSLLQSINNSFAQLPYVDPFTGGSNNGSSPTLNKKSNNSEAKLNTSILSKSGVDTLNSEIINLVISNTKDAKISLNKLLQQNKQLTREVQRLSQDVTSTNKKALNNQQQLSINIQSLQEELATLYSSKEQELIKSDDTIFGLNSKIRQRQNSIKELSMQIQQLQFTISNIKLDFQSSLEDSSKRQTILKKQILELKDQIQYNGGQISNLQDHIEKMEEELFTLNAQFEAEKDLNSKKQFKIQELLEQKQKLQTQQQQAKKLKKQLLQKISQLQLHLNSQKQLKNKQKTMLQEQQGKNSELKVFINNLMKQKQSAIKSQLQKSQQIINLQGNIIQLTRDKDIITEENQRNKKSIQDLKQQIKKSSKNAKDLQSSLNEQKSKLNKVSQKLKQKQKQVIIKDQSLVKLEQKYKRLSQKNIKQISDLQNQLDQKYTAQIISQKEGNQKSLTLQKQVNRLQSTVQRLKSQISQYEQFVFAGKQKVQQLTDIEKRHQQEIASLKQRVQALDMANTQLSQQVRQKEENLFQLSGKIYSMEMKIQAKQAQKNQKLDSINTDWVCKYQATIDQYQQRIQLIQKQKEYQKARIQEKESQNKKLINELKLNQSDGSNVKKVLQDKIKALQEDRVAVLSQKNAQIQRITEQNKQNFENLKTKQSQYRKLNHQLDIARATITKLDLKSKQGQQKIKNLNKVYQVQLEQLKKKEVNHKNFKQGLVNNIWKAQRQVRKTVQVFVKNVLSVTDQKTSKSLIQLTRNLQQNIVNSMVIKIQQKTA